MRLPRTAALAGAATATRGARAGDRGLRGVLEEYEDFGSVPEKCCGTYLAGGRSRTALAASAGLHPSRHKERPGSRAGSVPGCAFPRSPSLPGDCPDTGCVPGRAGCARGRWSPVPVPGALEPGARTRRTTRDGRPAGGAALRVAGPARCHGDAACPLPWRRGPPAAMGTRPGERRLQPGAARGGPACASSSPRPRPGRAVRGRGGARERGRRGRGQPAAAPARAAGAPVGVRRSRACSRARR